MTSSPAMATTTPSAKAAGKKPAVSAISLPNTASKTPTSKPGLQTRQKRVLPSRSRRGGPGVGNSDIDVMILETRKRRLENEPLIPATSNFLLTTKSSLVPPPSEGTSSTFELNTNAYGRYFDRPEVQQACKHQQLIQTPEFTQLPDDAIVGGRFRPRASEDETVDTSDAAYEKRHRKYESFEKRQRLREKEKLRYEQYKLKERIEQLRAMDAAAFLTLPASQFSEPPANLSDDDTDPEFAEFPGAHGHGSAAYKEGVRRRREMLETAQSLEDRYGVLLPRDNKWGEKKEKAKRESTSQSLDPDSTFNDEYEENDSEQPVEDPPESSAAHVSEPESQSKQDTDGDSEVEVEARGKDDTKSLKLRIKFPPRSAVAGSTNSHNPTQKFPKTKVTVQTLLPFASVSAPPITKSPSKSGLGRGANGRFTAGHKHHAPAPVSSASTSYSPAKKRPRAASPGSPAPSRHSHTSSTKTPCALMIAATRNATTPAARKTHRHVTAFGVRVPQEIEEVHDYELPPWVTSTSEDESEHESYGESTSYIFPDDTTWYDYMTEVKPPE